MFCVDFNEFVPAQGSHFSLAFVPGLELLDSLGHKWMVAKSGSILLAWVSGLCKRGLSGHPACLAKN